MARTTRMLNQRTAFIYIWCWGDECETVSNILAFGLHSLYIIMVLSLSHLHEASMKRFERSDGIWTVLVIPVELGYRFVYITRWHSETGITESLVYITHEKGLITTQTQAIHLHT